MTNVSAGSKRSWDGVVEPSSYHKRSREEPRDWRDVHLKSPGHTGHTTRVEGVGSRRGGEEYSAHRRGGDYGRGGNFGRGSDYGRDRSRREDRGRPGEGRGS